MNRTKSVKLAAGTTNAIAALFITALAITSLVKLFTDSNLLNLFENILFIPPLLVLLTLVLSLPVIFGVSIATAGGFMIDRALKESSDRFSALCVYSLICEIICVLVTISTATANASAIVKGHADYYNVVFFVLSAAVVLASTASLIFNSIYLVESKHK